ncbi:hypothetical protein D9619_006634 [Psilocybe cf. subviscida]|uniref:F-box domain-containing protein n=1 Tax=Psilocybe cf. subviscida TaxID=2480587 RepID=A0A8H5B4F5_9AGAR|nr:hypothetical protein D9619_006634 [Psilocybe cf. subviscida]
MVDLPLELWDHIATEADRGDLTNLALVSQLFSRACRRILVREIVLDHNYRKWQDIIRFIQRYELFASVQNLTICNFCTPKGKPRGGTGMKLFSKLILPNLRALTVINTSLRFATASKSQEPLILSLLRNSRRLESVRTSSVTSLEKLSENEFAISGLHNVAWDCRSEGEHSTSFMPSALFSLLHASSLTITHLEVAFVDNIDFGHAENYHRLYACQFPSLISLKLGPGDMSLLGDDAEQDLIHVNFTKFLTRHPTITELSLSAGVDFKGAEYEPEFDLSASYLPFDAGSLSVDILPNLTSLAAHSLQIKALTENDVESLHKITNLTVSSDLEDDPLVDVYEMLDQLASKAHNAKRGYVVKQLTLPLTYELPDDVVSIASVVDEWLEIACTIFPSLEKLVIPEIAFGRRAFCFPRFGKLRELECVWRPDAFHERHAYIIAVFCPSLEACHFRKPDGITYRIIRGSLESIHVDVEEDDQHTTDEEDSSMSTEDGSDIEEDEGDN